MNYYCCIYLVFYIIYMIIVSLKGWNSSDIWEQLYMSCGNIFGSVLLIITVTFKVVLQPATKLESLALRDLRIYGEQ